MASQALPGFADLLCLWTGTLLLPSIPINCVESPFPIRVLTMGRRPETRVVWRWILHSDHDARSRPQARILEAYDKWESWLPEESDAFHRADGECRAGSTLSSFLESIFEETNFL